jgi:hypothetical protein
VFAKKIHYARDSPGIGVNRNGSFRLKNGLPGTCGAQMLLNVSLGFLQGEGSGSTTHRDALAKLAQLVAFELFFKLGLASKNNLKEFFARSFEVQQQADFFQGVQR